MKWAGRVARTADEKWINKSVSENQGNSYSEDLGVDEKIILKWILK
jgi:hypothetical protein